MRRILFVFAALALSSFAPGLASTIEEPGFDRFIGDEPEAFADPAAAIAAFKAKLGADDFDGTAKLLGLDPVALATDERFADTNWLHQHSARPFRAETQQHRPQPPQR